MAKSVAQVPLVPATNEKPLLRRNAERGKHHGAPDVLQCQALYQDDSFMSLLMEVLLPLVTNEPKTDLEWIGLRARGIFNQITAAVGREAQYRGGINEAKPLRRKYAC